MKIRENIPLSSLTTMRLGGPARYAIEIESEDEIKKAYQFAKDKNLPTFILGGGANTIARDDGFHGVIIMNKLRGISITDPVSYLITAFGGESWDDVVKFTTERDLTGIEALSKIPGLAGAAPVQNIGAYGQDVSQVFESARVYDLAKSTIATLKSSDFGFSYRKSILNTTEKGRYFVISITLKLRKGYMSRPFYNSIEKYLETHPTPTISPAAMKPMSPADAPDVSTLAVASSISASPIPPATIRDIVSKIRQDKLPDPLEKASAGSFFKNIYLTPAAAKAAEEKGLPVYHGHDGLKINSAWLIEQCGFKGQLLHGIRVSATAPLVLINESATSYHDLALARAEIKAAVQEKFGYQLEQEPVEL